jgi:LAS superfamily LD-carboxypeptidase LdcB
MKEIKSVRVRRTNVKSGTLDIKVTLYEDKRTFGADDRVLVGFNNDRPVWIETTYRLKGIFKDFTDDQFITDFIDMNARSEGGGSEYEIIQDPWESKVPIWRKYGFDPYYLNNGAEIYINWTDENNMVVGGLTYSDNNGNEIDGQGVAGEGTVPSSFTKSHWIVGVDDPSKDQNFLLHLTKNNEIDYRKIGDVKEYGGLVKDIYIIEDIISAWKRKVPNYNELALCSPNNESCSIIPYKSPMKPIEPEPVPADVVPTNETPKEPIIVVLPESIKVKIDTTFKIFIGKNKELIETETVLQDDELTDLSDEYTEGDFAGAEEQVLELTSIVEEQDYTSEEIRQETEKQAEILNSKPYVPGKYKLDLIPGTLLGNNRMPVKCCQIDGKPVNVNIADAVLDLKAAAKKDGINLRINSGFRPDYGPQLNTKSEAGVSVRADSQEYLYSLFLKKGKPDTAKPGRSKHGNGIAVDFNTGSRTGAINQPLDPNVYSWMVKNSWRFGFVRTVKSEEWHFEYWGKVSGPYAKLPKSNGLFYADLGLNNLSVVA